MGRPRRPGRTLAASRCTGGSHGRCTTLQGGLYSGSRHRRLPPASCRLPPLTPPFFSQQAAAEPYCLLDATSWQMVPQGVVELLTTNQDFSVVGVLGAQGIGKSAFLNRLLGGRESP